MATADGHGLTPERLGLAQRLRSARLAARGGRGLAQQELAAILGISQATISDYERGRRQPTLPTLLQLAESLEVSIGWLAAGEMSPGSPVKAIREPVRILKTPLADLLNLISLPYLGRAGYLDSSGLVLFAPALGQAPQGSQSWSRAAETTPRYGGAAGAAGAVGAAGGGSDHPAVAITRDLCPAADSLALYAGPPIAGLNPGDIVLVGIPRATKRSSRMSLIAAPGPGGTSWALSDGAGDEAKEEHSCPRRPVVGLFRRFV